MFNSIFSYNEETIIHIILYAIAYLFSFLYVGGLIYSAILNLREKNGISVFHCILGIIVSPLIIQIFLWIAALLELILI